MSSEIILVRHGRSAHVETGWIDLHGFHRWREAYEAAGILPTEAPPEEVREMARRAGVVVASNAPRAIESARLLAEGREVITSPLVREREVDPPSLRLRLPLAGWALAYGIQWLFRALTSRPHATDAEITRAREATEWLTDLARRHGAVAVVTHASFRALLTRTLMAEGWEGDGARRRSRHWSAWRLSRQAWCSVPAELPSTSGEAEARASDRTAPSDRSDPSESDARARGWPLPYRKKRFKADGD